jgi:transglutaminase/protease-like cytokinesis protein 3
MNKRIGIILLALILSLCVCACTNRQENGVGDNENYITDDSANTGNTSTTDTITDDTCTSDTSTDNTTVDETTTGDTSADDTEVEDTNDKEENGDTSSADKESGDNTSTDNSDTENNTTGSNATGNGNTSSSITTEEERLAEIYWNYLGTAYPFQTRGQHEQGCDAAVKLVQNIMKTYKTEIEREIALYEYICDICEYGGEPADGQSPYSVLVLKQAVCGGYAKTFQVCMNMMGIQCDYISGPSSTSSHAWNQVCIDGEWYEVDCTWADWKTGAVYDCFNLTTAEMDQRDHAQFHVNRSRICYGGKYGKQYF